MRIILSMSTINQHAESTGHDSIDQNWIDWAISKGMTPYVIPNGIDALDTYVDSIAPDLVVLIGEESNERDKRRDLTERKLIDYCSRRKLPLLGVCRGMQEINRYYGGSLIKVKDHSNTEHEVILTTPWQKIYGDDTSVISDHTYGISETGIATDFKVTAIDTEGNIEAMIHSELPIVGIMWRPETQKGNLKDVALFKTISKGIIIRPDAELTLESILAT